MQTVSLSGESDFCGWRSAARRLLSQEVPPDEVFWSTRPHADLFADPEISSSAAENRRSLLVPQSFVALAETVSLHNDPQRFAWLYRVLWRLRDEPRLLDVAVDVDIARLLNMAKSVRRDIHKMRAFVRFRQTHVGDVDWYVAWFEPEHHIVETNAPFFMRRFATMNWSILTPTASAHWDRVQLFIGPGNQRSDAPADDAMEDLWRGYYASIFNPARLKVAAMRKEMPVKYWRNLPETPAIAPLIEDAQRRMEEMVATAVTRPNVRPQRRDRPAEPVAPDHGSLDELRADAAGCRACPLWAPATQTVLGEGPVDAPVMFVGEQPGDQEDLEGRPFVGPAGKLFDRALAEAGIDRSQAYVTNAVKHFKFEPRGKRRIHKRPNRSEVVHCRFWLQREIALLRPRLVVALGATAAQSLFGAATPVGQSRGRLLNLDHETARALVTVHPSYLLRLPDETAKQAEYAKFVADLRLSKEFFRRVAA